MSPSVTETHVAPATWSTKQVKPAPLVSEGHMHGGEDLTPLQAVCHGEKTLPAIPSFASPAEERKWLLEHMAAVFRCWARMGFCEGLSGHISVRDPEREAIWMNPLGKHFGLITAGDMICLDLEGRVIGGNRERPANAAGFLIHSAIHRTRPDVRAICHAHTSAGRAWASFGLPLDMLTQDVCTFHEHVAVYNDYGGIVFISDEGKRIAEALGPENKAAILMNHGLLTVGSTVDEAAFLFSLLDHSCEIQLKVEAAAGSGLKKVLIAPEEAAYNFKMASDPETLYLEWQTEYDFEDEISQGSFKRGSETPRFD
ncbi:hypothetical protein PV11_07616 [Exophiala sideris]|uniref:Class II aldolase/adducin N-terminal domain-containing protein n=1 Tax=Exophiala sideris TaxID=1016849 RepID=A0A0D1YGL3_9EURO|nr:hypothetical protein PV11_07616 [Exophiala sideris]